MTETATRRRVYRSPLREEQAARTRHRIIEAAADLFSTRGFGGTTMTAIARAADVSVESVHATGAKATLLLEAFRARYTGRGGWAALLEAEVMHDLIACTDPEEGIEQVVEFLATNHERSARLMLELRMIASVEPLITQEWHDFVALKRERITVSAEWMARIGIIDADVSPDDMAALAAEVNIVMSAETYLQLTVDWDFDDAQYRAWARRQLRLIRP
jgi:AcrR family transcriptional regulator